jgi:predicted GNAT family N-acyltransferase
MKKEPEFPLNIKWIDAKKDKDLEDAYQVRREVFILEQKVPEEEKIDEADLRSHHVVVYAADSPVATGRLFNDGKNWLIGRISVLKEFRGKHAGKLVVEKLLEKAAESGAKEVHVYAQTHAIDFYRKSGFVDYGDTFQEAGIKHLSMMKVL